MPALASTIEDMGSEMKSVDTTSSSVYLQDVEQALFSTTIQDVEQALFSTTIQDVEHALFRTTIRDVEQALFNTKIKDVEPALLSKTIVGLLYNKPMPAVPQNCFTLGFSLSTALSSELSPGLIRVSPPGRAAPEHD